MKLFGGRPPHMIKKIEDFFKHMPRKAKIIIAVCLVALAAIITAVAVVANSVKPPEKKEADVSATGEIENDVVVDGDAINVGDRAHKENFFTLLVVGRDRVGLNTDTIMLAAFDIEKGKINILSIPRDTMVNVKRSNKKINAAYSVGGKANIDELKHEVESVTGVMADRYAVVNIDGFIEMIDAIGGVTVDVPVNMVYNDPAQDLKINIKKGVRHLDGYNAMGFMRFRSTYVEGDIGRVKVQHRFVKALIDKMLTPSTLTKIPKLADIVMENVETDLSVGNIIWLAKEALNMNPQEDIETFLLPGEGGYYKKLSYYFAYKQQVLEMINEYFNPYIKPIKNINIIDPRGEEEKTSNQTSEDVSSSYKLQDEVPLVVEPQEQKTQDSKEEPEQEPEQNEDKVTSEEVTEDTDEEETTVQEPEAEPIPEPEPEIESQPEPAPEPEPEVAEPETPVEEDTEEEYESSFESVIVDDFYLN